MQIVVQQTRDLTPQELSDIQQRFPGVKKGEYSVFTMIGQNYLEPKPRAGETRLVTNPPEMPEGET